MGLEAAGRRGDERGRGEKQIFVKEKKGRQCWLRSYQEPEDSPPVLGP